MGQHPPVVPSGLGGVQAAAQLLPDGEWDAKRVGPHQRGDVAGRIQQRCVNALGILQRTQLHKKKRKKNGGRLILQPPAPATIHVVAKLMQVTSGGLKARGPSTEGKGRTWRQKQQGRAGLRL